MTWATVSKPIARRSRAATTRTGMRHSSPFTGGPRSSRTRGNPSYRWRPRRRHWWGRTAMVVKRGPPQGPPEEVNVHDFPDAMWGKIIPYGVYDEATHTGGVSVGVDHDTAELAVETVRRWWRHRGKP